METVFFFKNMLPAEEEQLRDYFSKKLPKLERLISHFPSDAILLHVKGEKFEKHSAYDVELTMKLPAETLTARETSHAITKAVDLAKDRIEAQLKKKASLENRVHKSLRTKAKESVRAATLA